jgi:hypothetical protein
MKACPDPAQALIDAFQGMVSRGLLGMSALVAACVFGTFPEPQLSGVLPFFFFPTIVVFVEEPLGLVAFLSAWACFIWFVRYDGGKWVFLTLVSAPTYGAILWELMLRDASDIRETQTWAVTWRDFHWPISWPLVALLFVATPDVINFFRRRAG